MAGRGVAREGGGEGGAGRLVLGRLEGGMGGLGGRQGVEVWGRHERAACLQLAQHLRRHVRPQHLVLPTEDLYSVLGERVRGGASR